MNLTLAQTFLRLGIALGLGLLVGLQRERAAAPLAGIRTFPLITVLGAVAALLAQTLGGWIVGAGLLALAVAGMAGKLVLRQAGGGPSGLTTDMAEFLMYGVGAYLIIGPYVAVAIAIAGTVAVLLQLKEPLHNFVQRLGEGDAKAIMQFTLVALVILPVLPDQAYGPSHVLNPHRIWLMVVLIVGLSLAGYVAHKVLGERSGTFLAGVLGGLISSTATAVGSARRAKAVPAGAGAAALVITLASAVLYARVLALMAAVNQAVLHAMAGPMACMLLVSALVCAVLYFLPWQSAGDSIAHTNPAELKTAVVFGLLFAVVLLATAAAKERLGPSGLYAVGVLAGLTDVDAITLTTASMVPGSLGTPVSGAAAVSQISADTAWRVILLASMSNLVFKAGAVAVLGGWRLSWRVGAAFGAMFVASAAVLRFWPVTV